MSYSICFIPIDTNIININNKKYDTWDMAINDLSEISSNLLEKYGGDITKLSVICHKSKDNCDKYGSVQIYKVMKKDEGVIGSIYIISSFGDTNP